MDDTIRTIQRATGQDPEANYEPVPICQDCGEPFDADGTRRFLDEGPDYEPRYCRDCIVLSLGDYDL